MTMTFASVSWNASVGSSADLGDLVASGIGAQVGVVREHPAARECLLPCDVPLPGGPVIGLERDVPDGARGMERVTVVLLQPGMDGVPAHGTLAVLVLLRDVQSAKVVLCRADLVGPPVRDRPGALRGGRVSDSQQARDPGERVAGRIQLAASAFRTWLSLPADLDCPDLVSRVLRIQLLCLRGRAVEQNGGLAAVQADFQDAYPLDNGMLAAQGPKGLSPRVRLRGRDAERRRVSGDRDSRLAALARISLVPLVHVGLAEADEAELANRAIRRGIPAAPGVELPEHLAARLLGDPVIRHRRRRRSIDARRGVEVFDGSVPGPADRARVHRRLGFPA